MKAFTARMKMADVVHGNYLLLPVISRFGISLGFGEKTVAEACREHDIDVDFFLVMVNAFTDEHFAPETQLRTSDVLSIVGYLEKTHKYYIKSQIPLIERLLNDLLRHRPSDAKNMRLIKQFFLEYKRELLHHLEREETTTFPYVREVCKLSGMESLTPGEMRTLSRYSMTAYAEEHTDVDAKLYDLKNILIKYVGGDRTESISREIVFELFRLEKDIQDHTRIEDNVLQPLVEELEKRLSRRSGRHVGRFDFPQRSAAGRKSSRREASGTPAPAKEPLQLFAERPGAGVQDPASLTAREREVLRLVAQGHLNKQIADRLDISLHTVISHRKNITRKLQIKTVAGLTVYALLNRFITPKDVS